MGTTYVEQSPRIIFSVEWTDNLWQRRILRNLVFISLYNQEITTLIMMTYKIR